MTHLTDDELDLIADDAVPHAPAKEYVRFPEPGVVKVTDRGRAFYEAACRLYGVAAPPRTIEDTSTLMDLTLRLWRIRDAYKHGDVEIPAHVRDFVSAALRGKKKAARDAARQRLSGSNVVRVAFGARV